MREPDAGAPNAATDAATGLPIGPQVDAAPARRPAGETLVGRFVRLEALDLARHADGLTDIALSPEADRLWLYMPAGPFASRADHRAYLEALAANAEMVPMILIDQATNAVLGQACYMRIDCPNRVVEVGNILYGPAAQGTPATTEAMYLMARHVFETLGFRRYEWKCNALNAPSRRTALRLGFTFEGIFRQAMIVKGRNRDTAWFSMLDSQWPALKARFEAWLAPENFDAMGRQQRALQAC